MFVVSSHLPFNLEGHWAPQMILQPVSSTALWDLANSRPVHSLMLSSHLFFCLPCLLPPFTVSCKMVLARPDKWETCPYHCSLCLFTIVRRSSCGPIACLVLAQTSSLVTWSLYEMRSILQKHLISMACILLLSSAVRVHDSQAYRKIDVTRERIRYSSSGRGIENSHLCSPSLRRKRDATEEDYRKPSAVCVSMI